MVFSEGQRKNLDLRLRRKDKVFRKTQSVMTTQTITSLSQPTYLSEAEVKFLQLLLE